MSTSSNERACHCAARPGSSRRPNARAALERKGSAAEFAERVADGWIKAQAYRCRLRTVTRLAAGGELGAESSVTKVFWSDLDVAIHQTALDILGADGELAGPD